MEAVLQDIQFAEIGIAELEKFMYVAFDGDADLLNIYHRKQETVYDLVLVNMTNIKEMDKENGVRCFGLSIGDIPVGFTVISKNLLYSFGINIFCRDKETVLNWFEWVKKVLNNDFVVPLYRENTRAINFFLRNEMEIFNENDEVIYLVYP